MIIISGQVSEALHLYVLELGYQKNIFNPTWTKLVDVPVLTNDIQKWGEEGMSILNTHPEITK